MSSMLKRALLAGPLTLALSGVAYAVPLRFENADAPDRIDWENSFVDLTKPASQQPGDLLFSVENSVSTSSKNKEIIITSGISPTGTVVLLGEFFNVEPLAFGEEIAPVEPSSGTGGGALFETTIAPGGDVSTEFSFPLGRWYVGASLGESIVEAERHAAWIFFDFFEGPDGIPDVDLLAWGYETEPGVPVAAGAPAPGAAGAFVIAGAAALRRRRRDGSESRPTRA